MRCPFSVLALGLLAVSCLFQDVGAQEPLKEQAKSAPAALLIGSKTSLNYHLPDCSVTPRIAAKSRVSFASAVEAVAQGYKACPTCKPPVAVVDAATRQAVLKADKEQVNREQADVHTGKALQRRMTLLQQQAWMRQACAQAQDNLRFAQAQLGVLPSKCRGEVRDQTRDLERRLANAEDRLRRREQEDRSLTSEQRQRIEEERIAAIKAEQKAIEDLTRQNPGDADQERGDTTCGIRARRSCRRGYGRWRQPRPRSQSGRRPRCHAGPRRQCYPPSGFRSTRRGSGATTPQPGLHEPLQSCRTGLLQHAQQ